MKEKSSRRGAGETQMQRRKWIINWRFSAFPLCLRVNKNLNMRLSKAISAILLAAVVAGTLDALAALVFYGPVLGNLSADRLFRGIACGAYGKEAFEEGRPFALYGILFHYLIALLFSIFFFLIFRRISFLRNHYVAGGILYGVFVWIVMNQIVIPLSQISYRGFHIWPAITGTLILILMVGLPISVIVHAAWARKSLSQ